MTNRGDAAWAIRAASTADADSVSAVLTAAGVAAWVSFLGSGREMSAGAAVL